MAEDSSELLPKGGSEVFGSEPPPLPLVSLKKNPPPSDYIGDRSPSYQNGTEESSSSAMTSLGEALSPKPAKRRRYQSYKNLLDQRLLADSIISPLPAVGNSHTISSDTLETTSSSHSRLPPFPKLFDFQSKSHYGWFVDHDDDGSRALPPPILSRDAGNLAFYRHGEVAHQQLDLELEVAQAADLVDEVLGEFF